MGNYPIAEDAENHDDDWVGAEPLVGYVAFGADVSLWAVRAACGCCVVVADYELTAVGFYTWRTRRDANEGFLLWLMNY